MDIRYVSQIYMEDLLRSECPHCSQALEYPASGAGEAVQCPNCGESFELASAKDLPGASVNAFRSMPSAAAGRAVLPPQRTGPPVIDSVVVSVATTTASRPPTPAPLERVLAQIEHDPSFSIQKPTREQVARAWAMANFNKEDESKPPTYEELVNALRKLFKEFSGGRHAVKGANGNRMVH